MRFVEAFIKVADMSRHNDGTEFKMTDNEPMAFAPGPGGMAPSGIPTYQPSGSTLTKSGPKDQKKQALINVLMGKLGADASDFLGQQGSAGQSSDTLASQLKYEATHDDILPDKAGYNGGMRSLKKLRRGAKK